MFTENLNSVHINNWTQLHKTESGWIKPNCKAKWKQKFVRRVYSQQTLLWNVISTSTTILILIASMSNPTAVKEDRRKKPNKIQIVQILLAMREKSPQNFKIQKKTDSSPAKNDPTKATNKDELNGIMDG